MTFEDVKRIRQNPTAEDVDNQELHKMIDLAVEKQIPKKPRTNEDGWFCCRNCGETFSLSNTLHKRNKFCGECGQALDWGDSE